MAVMRLILFDRQTERQGLEEQRQHERLKLIASKVGQQELQCVTVTAACVCCGVGCRRIQLLV